MKKTNVFAVALSAGLSVQAHAALIDVTISGQVIANMTSGGICRTQGFNVCHYLPLGDSVSMTFRYDDSSAISYIQNGTSAYYDNAIKSLTISTTAIGYSGNATGDFGQIIVRNSSVDGLTFRFWEPTQTSFAYATANPMDMTTLQTSLAFAPDDVYGNIEIHQVSLNLTSLSNTVFGSLAIPTDINLADFDNANSTNWSFGLRSASGFGGTVAMSITGVSVQAVSAVPVPAAAWLFASGLLGLVEIARRKNTV